MSGRITTLCTVLGVAIATVGLYLPYRNELNNYLYQKEFLTGKWSTDAEYVINSRDLGLDISQPVLTVNLNVDKDGSIDGNILSETLCESMPMTEIITLNSDSPSLKNFVFARTFEVRQLINGAMDKSPVVATLKLINEDQKHNAITFEVVSDATGMLPKKLIFGKDLPKFDENYKFLQDYCAKASANFYDKLIPEIKRLRNSPKD